MPQKGEEIRFVKGKYMGEKGWINTEKTCKTKVGKKEQVYVIVDLERGEKSTRVNKSSIRDKFSAPMSHEEAAMQQHKELELAMIQLAELWAECGITNVDNALALLSVEIGRAVDEHNKLSKAPYRQVEFEEFETGSAAPEDIEY